MVRQILTVAMACLMVVGASAQQIPPPSGPVTFCGTQATPVAESYTIAIDGAAAVPLTMDATVNAACPAGTTHSFQVPASAFPIGAHTLVVAAVNAFGATAGPSFAVTVGIAPGAFTITALIPPGA